MAPPVVNPNPAPACAADSLHIEIVSLVVDSLGFILGRQRESYPFIDTKFSLTDGVDFSADDPLRNRNVIYSWIQGRGLEALAGHADWLLQESTLDHAKKNHLITRINAHLPHVIGSMEAARRNNGGRLPFIMTPDGRPLTIGAGGEVQPASPETLQKGHSLSDLFYAKGLLAAASHLGDDTLINEAESLWFRIVDDLRAGRFQFGQLALDPKNPVQNVPGRFSHAGRMIGIGAATLFYRHTNDARHAEIGTEFIEHILTRHTAGIDGDGFAHSRAGDFWEFIDITGAPWRNADGQVWSDSGHATEFTGLALAHLQTLGTQNAAQEKRLIEVLRRNFSNGFASPGIVKSFDLAARRPINGDMPWWSLPETMRAAALASRTMDTAHRSELNTIFHACWDTFTRHYVRPEQGSLAVQCIDPSGSVSSAIPAVPDADPCYHTGLSLIGCR